MAAGAWRISARHYLPFAQALAERGCAVSLHEWRGHGSSSLRASRRNNWGFTQLLQHDLPAALRCLQSTSIPGDSLGGHSLGGQLSCCFASELVQLKRLWLVASGSPHWASFPGPRRWSLPPVYTALPLLANARGYLPGRQLGFGGREARGLIADWARVGRSGNYRIPDDVQSAMARLQLQCSAVILTDDWLAPAGSLSALQAKLPGCSHAVTTLDSQQIGTRADHFAWMGQPAAIAAALVKNISP